MEVWWSAHLIRPSLYAKFCSRRFGVDRLIDRSDFLLTNPLRGDMTETAKLWRAEYNEEYAIPTVPAAAKSGGDTKSVAANSKSTTGSGGGGGAAATVVVPVVGVEGVSESELHELESSGLVHLDAVIKDRAWLRNMTAYAKIPVQPSELGKLRGEFGRCSKGHPLLLYKTGVKPVRWSSDIATFKCMGSCGERHPLDHYYYCEVCDTAGCKDCVRVSRPPLLSPLISLFSPRVLLSVNR